MFGEVSVNGADDGALVDVFAAAHSDDQVGRGISRVNHLVQQARHRARGCAERVEVVFGIRRIGRDGVVLRFFFVELLVGAFDPARHGVSSADMRQALRKGFQGLDLAQNVRLEQGAFL